MSLFDLASRMSADRRDRLYRLAADYESANVRAHSWWSLRQKTSYRDRHTCARLPAARRSFWTQINEFCTYDDNNIMHVSAGSRRRRFTRLQNVVFPWHMRREDESQTFQMLVNATQNAHLRLHFCARDLKLIAEAHVLESAQ